MRYRVEVTREGDAWVAQVADLPGAHTFASSLDALLKDVDEVIRLVEDLDEEAPVKQLWHLSALAAD